MSYETEAKSQPNAPGAGARLLIDLGPLVVFFVTNFFAPVPDTIKIFVATGAFMIAMMVAMLISQIKYRHISPLLWFSGLMVVVLGGLTIWLHNETFIKIKPTIYYLIVAALLIFGMTTGRNLLKMVLGTAYPGLSDRGWQLLTRNWAAFFIVMAVLNEAIWRTQTTDFWVGFKLWFFLPATLVFAAANVPMLMRHGLALEEAETDAPVPPTQ
ncbi:septation protein A [Sphingosinicella sp. LHD-64]|uniref:septation protein A n=1 Tax=Sphingosinicella sp. LHD-64 TaxID=3072139 RepID=UPI00280ECF3B|nr:septation protein A [Sphingosinicella sp. LHD-64]MDQ8755362.1 septation protein A [Sphingosinicella sp. LHD-64]